MKQVINIIIDNPRIENLRRKYDVNYKKFKTHLTLVYPFEVKDQEKLKEHILFCLARLEPFEIVFQKVRKSKNFLVLDVTTNRQKLLDLYKKLNSGILAGFENKEISIYLPHLTLGVFDSNEALMEVINELRSIGSNYRILVDKINLATLNEDNSIKDIETFVLK
jgi:2'-5' RNA ligase